MWGKYPEVLDELKQVEVLIKENTSSRNSLLSEAVGELVEAGGKRMRPAFVILAAKFGKYDRKKVLPAAGALEILHTATLVHDDIVDRSGSRRGRATVSGKFGIDMAVYTGDFLYTRALLMLSRNVPVERLEILARAIKSICEGEVDQYRDRYNIGISVASYLKKASRKTALLFGSACALGAYTAKCPQAAARALAKFGFYYGMAFQIRDDLNDFLYDADKTGKPVGKDIEEGVMTLPVIYALHKSEAVRNALKDSKEKKIGVSSPGNISDIMALVQDSGGIEDAKDMLKRYIGRGQRMLEALPANNYRNIFRQLIEELNVF